MYTLLRDEKSVVKEGTFEEVTNEINKIKQEVGSEPAMQYDIVRNMVEFRFFGYWCDFSLYLKYKDDGLRKDD